MRYQLTLIPKATYLFKEGWGWGRSVNIIEQKFFGEIKQKKSKSNFKAKNFGFFSFHNNLRKKF